MLHLAICYTVRSVVAALSAAVLCACAPAAKEAGTPQRVLAIVTDPAQLRDPAQLEAQIRARTGIRAALGTPVSERIVPLTLACPRDDADCTAALRALRSSGLFESVELEGRRKRQ
ncbi:MAG TPA: hypothetical protein VFR86_08630 [Burkholderiaceae bacterium]|nr:hypothetical protein [Burkholderiaceae bacterium]